LKQRLRVIAAAPRGAIGVEPARASDELAGRVAVSEPLICIASESETGIDFACSLIAALRARGCPSIALCEAESGASTPSVERAAQKLRSAGAEDVVLLARTERRAHALNALKALPAGAVAVAVGTELAAQLAGLLVIVLDRRTPVDDAVIDLELRAESIGVAAQLGTWLAERFGRTARGSYQ
jgi:hypothetical protein